MPDLGKFLLLELIIRFLPLLLTVIEVAFIESFTVAVDLTFEVISQP